ncbi:Peroxisomal membrane protein (Pex16) [Musa troglodytarum]|uniref:Peroxisomal membrane protein PEX16 n=1 Tax=Musa troglodytarum TaxID=320322 RepID=A0A9E7LC76_9LILI|nr:Peroxisomal membrane protein (Pex16) [Musa troglodytarum]URE48112.1 Peroxisomal membrane protein (Pex16) [Musa troglodytarum]
MVTTTATESLYTAIRFPFPCITLRASDRRAEVETKRRLRWLRGGRSRHGGLQALGEEEQRVRPFLESLANGITWLLPERFSNSEIGSEAVYALLGIISTVNQHIIDTSPTRMRPHGFGKSTFPWSLCVSALKDVETVVEVAAQQFVGEERKWNYLAVTEAVKVFVRLTAFHDSGYKMLLQGGELVNMDERLEVSRAYHARNGDSGVSGGYNRPEHIHGYHGSIPRSLEGRAISALSRFGENAKMASNPMWLNKLCLSSEATPALLFEKPTFSTLWFQKGLSGEVLSVLRPLIYVLFIRRYGIRSWKPWLISLAVDLAGMNLLSHSTTWHLKKRKLVWALYIMRDPFFSQYTKHHLEKTDRYLSRIPLLGFLTAKLAELIVGAQTRYTYTSGS